MELKYVIPNMEKTFGQLEYAGEGNIEQRRVNGRPTILSRSYNLYSVFNVKCIKQNAILSRELKQYTEQ